jgi:peptide-methionine (S)-S-oxide reductase
MTTRIETAIFGGGCFWCTEAIFKLLKGVTSVMSGYASSPRAEVVKINFDPKIIPYRDLLDIFLHTHDPTTLNRQGADVGTQYRSIILYTSADQKKTAEAAIDKNMVTKIEPLEKFFPAEDYHRNFFENHQDSPYCRLVISPKLQHLREKYSNRVNTS